MAPKSLPLCDTNYEAANMYDVKEAWLSSGWEKKENSDPYVRPFREYFPMSLPRIKVVKRFISVLGGPDWDYSTLWDLEVRI